MVVVFSSNANLSSQIKREVNCAVGNNVDVLPFRIENILPSGALEYLLGTTHWLDAIVPPLEKHIGLLTEKVKFLLNQGELDIPSKFNKPTASSYLSAITQRFRAEGFECIENVAYENQNYRLVARKRVFVIGETYYILAEFPTFTLNYLKQFSVNCTNYIVGQKRSWIKRLSGAIFCAPIALVDGVEAIAAVTVVEEKPFIEKVADSGIQIYVLPSIYDLSSKSAFFSQRTILEGSVYLPMFRKTVKEKLSL